MVQPLFHQLLAKIYHLHCLHLLWQKYFFFTGSLLLTRLFIRIRRTLRKNIFILFHYVLNICIFLGPLSLSSAYFQCPLWLFNAYLSSLSLSNYIFTFLVKQTLADGSLFPPLSLTSGRQKDRKQAEQPPQESTVRFLRLHHNNHHHHLFFTGKFL